MVLQRPGVRLFVLVGGFVNNVLTTCLENNWTLAEVTIECMAQTFGTKFKDCRTDQPSDPRYLTSYVSDTLIFSTTSWIPSHRKILS